MAQSSINRTVQGTFKSDLIVHSGINEINHACRNVKRIRIWLSSKHYYII